MGSIASIFKPVVDFALPSRCPVCGIIVENDHHFCSDCWRGLDFISEPWCDCCGIPFAFERPDGSVCASCLIKPPSHDGVRAAVAYDSNSAKIAMGLKYSARLGFANLIASHLQRYMTDISGEKLIVPVPLHRRRIWSRGFNQSQLIAKALSENSKLSVSNNVIERIVATPPLRSMSSKQRTKIVRKAFSLKKDARLLVEGKVVILVDDVYTTGSTANACAKLLHKAGADKVFVFCWARVISGEESV